MISKVIVHAPSRKEAIDKMKDAINGYEITGVDTTLDFGKFAITHPAFISGQFDTHFVEKHIHEFLESETEINHTLARFAAWIYEKKKSVLVLPKMTE